MTERNFQTRAYAAIAPMMLAASLEAQPRILMPLFGESGEAKAIYDATAALTMNFPTLHEAWRDQLLETKVTLRAKRSVGRTVKVTRLGRRPFVPSLDG